MAADRCVDLRGNGSGLVGRNSRYALERAQVAFERLRRRDLKPIFLRRLVRCFVRRQAQLLCLRTAGLDLRFLCQDLLELLSHLRHRVARRLHLLRCENLRQPVRGNLTSLGNPILKYTGCLI